MEPISGIKACEPSTSWQRTSVLSYLGAGQECLKLTEGIEGRSTQTGPSLGLRPPAHIAALLPVPPHILALLPAARGWPGRGFPTS